MTSVAVTGASGFLGQHVLAALKALDVGVVAHSRASKPAHPSDGSVEWIYFDLDNEPDHAFDRLHRPDVVVHLAWAGLPNYTSRNHFEIELPRQYRFLSGLVADGLKKLVVAGTCFEYGMSSGQVSEETPTDPVTPYGFAKDALRRELEFAAASNPFELRWARLFYLFGAGQAATSLFTSFHAAMARGDASFRMSGGEQIRDFMSADAAGAAIAALALATHAPRIVNICSGVPRKVRSIVETWRRDAGSDIQLGLGAKAYLSYEPFCFWGDRGRLTAVLNETGPSVFRP